MRHQRLTALCGALVLLMAGCQPAVPNAPASTPAQVLDPTRSVISLGGNTGARISLSAQTLFGMRVQDLPKALRDVDHFTATLWRTAPDPLAGTQLAGATAALTRGNNWQVTFADVPAGVYEMHVSAMATTDESTNITKVVSGNAYAVSTNTVTIDSGNVTYSDTGNSTGSLTAVVPLLDGNNANLTVGPIDVVIPVSPAAGSRGAALTGADKVGLTLVNNGSYRAKALTIDSANGFQLVNIQQGAHTDALGNPGGPTHEVWSYAVNTTTSTATPARPTYAAANATGALTGPINVSIPVPTLTTTAAPLSPVPATSLVTDSSDNVYYYDGANIQKVTAGTVSTAVAAPGTVTALTIDTDDNLYWSDGTQILVKRGAAAPAQAVASVTTAQFLTIDAEYNLYWYDGTDIKKASFTGQTWRTPVSALVAPAGLTQFAVDPYGNIYYADATGVQKADLDLAGVTYGTPAQMAAQTNINGLAIDRAGNAYLTTSTGHKVLMVGAAQPTIFTVAGLGTGNGSNSIGNTTPTAEDLQAPTKPVMSKSGKLYFLSLGTGGTGQYLRWIQ